MIGSSSYGAFQLRPGLDLSKMKIECIDVCENNLYYGDNKGNVTLTQLSVDIELKAQSSIVLNVSLTQ